MPVTILPLYARRSKSSKCWSALRTWPESL